MNESTPARLSGVSKTYGRTSALASIDFEVRSGETLALLGPNGAGKSTALRVLLGIVAADSGTATLFGADPRNHRTRRRVGAMLQGGGVAPTLTVAEHVALFSSYYPRPLPAGEALERAGVTDLARRRFGGLSGGQQQRVLFALALCGDPDLLVLDEPTNALDVEARRLLWRSIRAYVRDGRSVLLATHDLTEAERLANRIAVLRGGRVVQTGSAPELIARNAAASFEDAVLSVAGIAPELAGIS